MMINNFIVPLVLTILIEEFIAYALGYRDKQSILIVLLVNAITNPILNYIILFLFYLNVFSQYFVILLEISVVIVEWRILTYALKRNSKRMLLLSLAMNAASYIFGVVFYN